MTQSTHLTAVPMQVIQGCLVASIQVELSEDLLRQFQEQLLERIGSTRVQGVVLDVSGVEVMDAMDFEMLRSTMAMAEIMGAKPMLVGLKPGIVSALVDMDVEISRVRAALNVDDALRMLSAPSHASDSRDNPVSAETEDSRE